MLLKLILFVYWFFLFDRKVFARIKINAFPSSEVLNSTELQLTCSVSLEVPETLKMIWLKDSQNIAEECYIYEVYRSFDEYKCTHTAENNLNSREYIMVLKNVNLKDSGEWHCCLANHCDKTQINVIVPAIVSVPKISPLSEYPDMAQVRSLKEQSKLNDRNLKGIVIGSGNRYDPIDLTKFSQGGAHGITVECETQCSTSRNDLIWKIRNMTWNSTIYSESLSSSICAPGLYSVRERTTISCVYGPQFESRSTHTLIGLNRITCLSDNGEMIRRIDGIHKRISRETKPLSPIYQPVGNFAELQMSSFAPECINNGLGRSSCVYILCPAIPRDEFLTNGEKTAIGVSMIILVIFLVTITCCRIKNDRSRKKKDAKMKMRYAAYSLSCPQTYNSAEPYMGYSYQC